MSYSKAVYLSAKLQNISCKNRISYARHMRRAEFEPGLTRLTIVANSPWDIYKNDEKPYSSQLLHPCTLHVPPLPLE